MLELIVWANCRLVQRRRSLFNHLVGRPSSIAGISTPRALNFENMGMLRVFNPEVCNGWSLADSLSA